MTFKTWEEMSELEQLNETYVEMYKEVHGIKARWYKAETVEQVKADLQLLAQIMDAEIEAERLAADKAIKEFQDKAAEFGFDRWKRYQHQAYDTDGTDSHLEYRMGLPYGFFANPEAVAERYARKPQS